MSESTELTFVRCPHCRSLVPAASKTCRMCGESLDASAKAEDPKNSNSRVRQRTMSTANEGISNAVNRVREEGASAAIPSASESAPKSNPIGNAFTSVDTFLGSGSAEIDDPLGAYIQELSMGEQAAKKAPPAPAPIKTAVPLSMLQERTSEHKPINGLASNASGDTNSGTLTPPAEVLNKPKLLVESGAKRLPKASSLTFARPKIETNETPKSDKMDEPTEQPSVEKTPTYELPEMTEEFDLLSSNEDLNEVVKPVEKSKPELPKQEISKPESSKQEARKPESSKPEHTPLSMPANKASIPPPTVATAEQTGRLVGWLVSYKDPNGKAFELREGRFFISKSSLKSTDFIVDDDSISTPHAIVMVTGSGYLKIQDLMSERGVFQRGRGTDAYQRAGEVIEVRHGDWVRFGEVEYLICLIEFVGQK